MPHWTGSACSEFNGGPRWSVGRVAHVETTSGPTVSPELPPAELEFFEQLRTGDAQALAMAYDRHAPMVFHVAYRLLGEQADAEDLVHDVFVGLSRAVQSFEGRGTFEAWLKRVAVRAALMKLRQQHRSQDHLWRRLWVAPRFQREALHADRLDLEAAIDALPPSLRTVFVLKEVQGFSHAEIAELLGIGIGAARVRLCRARYQLRTYLSSE